MEEKIQGHRPLQGELGQRSSRIGQDFKFFVLFCPKEENVIKRQREMRDREPQTNRIGSNWIKFLEHLEIVLKTPSSNSKSQRVSDSSSLFLLSHPRENSLSIFREKLVDNLAVEFPFEITPKNLLFL